MEYEKYSLTQKNKELETTLDKLRDKYILLRDKYNRVASDSSKLQSSVITETPAHSGMVKSAAVRQPPAAMSVDANHGMCWIEVAACSFGGNLLYFLNKLLTG